MIDKVGTKYKLMNATGTKVIGYFNTRNEAVEFNHGLMKLQIQKEKNLERQYRLFGIAGSIWTTKN